MRSDHRWSLEIHVEADSNARCELTFSICVEISPHGFPESADAIMIVKSLNCMLRNVVSKLLDYLPWQFFKC